MDKYLFDVLKVRCKSLDKSGLPFLFESKTKKHKVDVPGWENIINALSEVIVQQNPEATLAYCNTDNALLVVQIFSSTTYGEAAAIRAAAYYSQRVCEVFGTPGDLVEQPLGKIRILSPRARSLCGETSKRHDHYSCLTKNECTAAHTLPPASIRSSWNISDVQQQLRGRWNFSKNCEFSIPPIMYDLVDCSIASISLRAGSRGGRLNGPAPLITHVSWSIEEGLDIRVDKASHIAVINSERDRQLSLKSIDQSEYSLPLLFDRKCLETQAMRLFAATMSKKIDLGTCSILPQ